MGLFDLFKRAAGGGAPDRPPGGTLTVDELARRLGMTPAELQAARPDYNEFTVPKRSGGTRRILAPDDATKALQRRLLRRVLGRLKAHPAAHGFERGRSIVTNALPHARRAVVLRMDLKDFFDNTADGRVDAYFRKAGWNAEAAVLLTRVCAWKGGLPQGAPTSPRLSNLVNGGLDARLTGLAAKYDAVYTRYADDLTFSFAKDDPTFTHTVIRAVKMIVAEEGYALHQKSKLHIRRRHEQQRVTGLVVNERAGLPRRVRRWLRAVTHRAGAGDDKAPTLTPQQIVGWRSLQFMIAKQSGTSRGAN